MIKTFFLLYNTADLNTRNKMWRYQGTKNTTVSGRPCQYWEHQWPHEHVIGSTDAEFPDRSVQKAANFCRNPNREVFLWCFTMDINLRAESCKDNDYKYN